MTGEIWGGDGSDGWGVFYKARALKARALKCGAWNNNEKRPALNGLARGRAGPQPPRQLRGCPPGSPQAFQ